MRSLLFIGSLLSLINFDSQTTYDDANIGLGNVLVVPWPMHLIDPDPASGSDGVKLADVNHDGLPDLVSGFEESGVSRIYIHPG